VLRLGQPSPLLELSTDTLCLRGISHFKNKSHYLKTMSKLTGRGLGTLIRAGWGI
jgi:hypothetical protein